jgi:hypothetical protein
MELLYRRDGGPTSVDIRLLVSPSLFTRTLSRVRRCLRTSAIREPASDNSVEGETDQAAPTHRSPDSDDATRAVKVSDRLAGTKWGQTANQTAIRTHRGAREEWPFDSPANAPLAQDNSRWNWVANWRRRPDLNRRMEVLQTSAGVMIA